jgi:hypothetical protein
MADEPVNLTLEYLRRIDTRLDGMAADIRELKSTVAGMLQILASQDNHMLRMEVRLGRIEERLGLVDPAIPG